MSDSRGSRARGSASRPWRSEQLAYDAIYAGLMGVMAPTLLWRLARGKSRAGWKHKLGFAPERDRRERFWIHAVSVGEAVVADILAGRLRTEFPEHDIVVSTTTPTGQEVARRRFGEGNTFYLPIDFSGPVRRSFARVKPTALVLMEGEVWPNLVAEAARRDVPVVVANGRISERAFPRYERVTPILRRTFRRLAAVCAQNEDYARKFVSLGARRERVVVTGTMKYDGVSTEPDPASESWAREALRVRSGERVLIGGSTHRTEELALAVAWRGIASSGRSGAEIWRLVIAPRHPPRVPEVESDLRGEGFRTVRRSELEGGSLDPETIIIVDTVGELGRFYHASDLVFVGGSLIPHGGQNPIEPAGLGKPVVFGPHMFNFEDTAQALLESGGAREVASAEALAAVVSELASDARAREGLGQAARRAVISRQGAAERTVRAIRNALAGKPPAI